MAQRNGIQRFLDQADPRILERGQAYFRSHKVNWWRMEHGHVTAEVSGNAAAPYRVELELDFEGTVSGCVCSCPYDQGPVCKHLAAVLMTIQAERPERLKALEEQRRKREASLCRLVDQAGRDLLADLLLEHCREDRRFMSRVLSELEDTGEEEYRSIRSLVLDSIEINTEGGMIDPEGYETVCAVLDGSLERARRRIGRGQPERGLEMALFVLLTGVRLARRPDVSGGALPWTVDDAIDTVALAVQRILTQGIPGEPSLNRILKTARDPAFEGWEHWQYDLLNQGAELVEQASEPSFLEVLDGLRAKLKKRLWDGPRYVERDCLLRYRLLRTLHEPAEAGKWLEENLNRDLVRQLLVLERLREEDFAGAEALCLQRLGTKPCGQPELWRRLLYEVYRDWGRREDQLAQARELERMGKAEYGRRPEDLVRRGAGPEA